VFTHGVNTLNTVEHLPDEIALRRPGQRFPRLAPWQMSSSRTFAAGSSRGVLPDLTASAAHTPAAWPDFRRESAAQIRKDALQDCFITQIITSIRSGNPDFQFARFFFRFLHSGIACFYLMLYHNPGSFFSLFEEIERINQLIFSPLKGELIESIDDSV
jgi:hypothetical protein